jgi:conjugation system TraG family ATPase
MEQVVLDERMPILEVASDAIVNKLGDVTMALELTKPEIFTMGEEDYGRLHAVLVKAAKVLAPGTILHMQDTYWRDKWRPEKAQGVTSFLGRASNRFFDGRPWLRHRCILCITRRPAGRGLVDSGRSGLLRSRLVPQGTLDDRAQRGMEDAVGQFAQILGDSGLVGVRRLTTAELASARGKAGVIEQYTYLLDSDKPVLRDIRLRDGLAVGDRECALYTLADADHLPANCSPSVPYERFSSAGSVIRVGFMARLGLLLQGDHIVNTFIVIGDTASLKKLEQKRLRLQSFGQYSRGNILAAEATNAYLQEAMGGQRVPVRVHVNVMAWTDRAAELRDLRARLVSAIAGLDAVAHEETVGAAQLWWAAIPGNAGELPDNECFDSLLDTACCFLPMEGNYRSSSSPYGVRFGDRLTGRPVNVDIDVEPRRQGLIQNGNFFVLAGSGGGKSFLMNHLCRTWYDQGMHIVIVDVGHSYRGLCGLVGGVYYEYEEKKPMRFNPFRLGPGEVFDTEKKESLKSLLLALWKRTDETQYRSEYVALSDAVQVYYEWLAQGQEEAAGFDSFYAFMRDEYVQRLSRDGVSVKEFDSANFLYVLRPYYKGGEFDYLLNAPETIDLIGERFIVFELDNIRDHPILLPVVTLVVMEVFLAKMRRLRGVRKLILIEEAWKAIANAGMAENIRYWVKTLRKHMGKLGLVSQEVEDVVESPVIKQAILNNSDTKIILDLSKFRNRFEEIRALLGLTEKQQAEILSINKGHEHGSRYKDPWIGLGSESHVYRLEVSLEEYLVYTTDQAEKLKVEEAVRKHGSWEKGITALAAEMRSNQ